jgi:hypothetical protein
MKIALFIIILCLALQNNAQETKKKATVQIQKVESIDGVVKTTDTTYTTDDPSALENETSFQNIAFSNGAHCKTVIVNENVTGNSESAEGFRKMVFYCDSSGGKNPYTMMTVNSDVGAEMEKALKEARGSSGFVFNTAAPGNTMIMSDGMVIQASGGSKTINKVIFIKAVKITDPSEAETKKASSNAGPTNGKLSVTDIKFYPNPSNGKFNLSFTTPGKGDAEITIVNADGKKVFSESLPDFKGRYDKEVDLSENPKGIYFVRIQQGKHSQMKKLVIE